MERESFLFAVRAAGKSEHAAGLDLLESSDRISACIVKEQMPEKAIMVKVSRLPPSARRHARQDLVGMCTILRAYGKIYVIRKGPIICTLRYTKEVFKLKAQAWRGLSHFSPSQSVPLPVYPLLHVQRCDPELLTQSAFIEQLCCPVAQLSTSKASQKMKEKRTCLVTATYK